MALYSASNTLGAGTPAAMNATGKTYLSLTSPATTRRGRIFFWSCGIYDTPDDRVILWRASLQTTVGTGTTVTATPFEPNDAAALLVSTNNHSVEPTLGAMFIEQAINMRASWQWNAHPKKELVIPAVSGNGIGMRAMSPLYTGTGARVQWCFEE